MSPHEGAPLHLRSITIKNIRCFQSVKLDLKSPKGPRMWGVIFGENGVGKTTLLRCIAMGLCDAASAAGLLREIYGEWNRSESGVARKGEIHLDFYSEEDEVARISTYIIPGRSGYSQVEQQTQFARAKRDFPWDRIFACGYGAARRAFGTRDIEDYATVDSVYSLFNYDPPLQNPELVLRRVLTRSRKRPLDSLFNFSNERVKKLIPLLDSICKVLLLPPGSIKLTVRGLAISGPWGTFQPIGGVGDGFQATLSWLTDLIGWAILYDPEQPIELVRGIVLVDELEQHLHPQWQRQIIKLLSEQFPHIQFIVTTHTPMCAIGTTDLDDN
jgi:predicted ATPase